MLDYTGISIAVAIYAGSHLRNTAESSNVKEAIRLYEAAIAVMELGCEELKKTKCLDDHYKMDIKIWKNKIERLKNGTYKFG